MTKRLKFDADGYVMFEDLLFTNHGVGLIWTLHRSGWEAYVNRANMDNYMSLYSTGDMTEPARSDLDEAHQLYENAWDNQQIEDTPRKVNFARTGFQWQCPVCLLIHNEKEIPANKTAWCINCERHFVVVEGEE